MNIGIIFDLITVIVLLLFVWRGYKKGLVGLVYGIIAFLISIVISFILYIPISNYIINNTVLDDNIAKVIETRLSNKDVSNEVTQDDMNNTSKIIVNYANKYADEVKNDGINIVAVNISQSIVRAMVLIILYLIARIILVVLKELFKSLSELPIIKQCDKMGGIAIGALKGLLILYAILAAISLLAPLKENDKLMEGINKSYITSLMYNNNVILMLVLK